MSDFSFALDFTKNLDINIDQEFNTVVDIDVDVNKDVEVDFNVNTDVEGNSAFLEGTAEAIGYDTFSEVTFNVEAIEDTLSSVAVAVQVAVD